MAHIEIDDGLYERIAKIARARPLPTSAEREIEKAIVHRLIFWELFFFGGPTAAQKANFPKGDTT